MDRPGRDSWKAPTEVLQTNVRKLTANWTLRPRRIPSSAPTIMEKEETHAAGRSSYSTLPTASGDLRWFLAWFTSVRVLSSVENNGKLLEYSPTHQRFLADTRARKRLSGGLPYQYRIPQKLLVILGSIHTHSTGIFCCAKAVQNRTVRNLLPG